MSKIELAALDADGYKLIREDVFNRRKEARERAKRIVDEKELIDAGMFKVELCVDGECIYDWLTTSEGR